MGLIFFHNITKYLERVIIIEGGIINKYLKGRALHVCKGTNK